LLLKLPFARLVRTPSLFPWRPPLLGNATNPPAPSGPRDRARGAAQGRGHAVAVAGHPGAAGGGRGLPRAPVRGHQPLRHPRQTRHHHAEGHPARAEDTRRLGRRRLGVSRLRRRVWAEGPRGRLRGRGPRWAYAELASNQARAGLRNIGQAGSGGVTDRWLECPVWLWLLPLGRHQVVLLRANLPPERVSSGRRADDRASSSSPRSRLAALTNLERIVPNSWYKILVSNSEHPCAVPPSTCCASKSHKL